ncbi:G1 family glutamic endopeptidase [Streptacidiphilus jiangxiensis]|uniref:Peptidase A4 family protein n=1 Tax=Streptacidiphilus jiangxiensis TaxID=235985 RepID=A0A1H7W1P7_STRJI|nr:G1 family glutamic endopeptidase [Streptacidiphilus jiangxiensis]SEM15019.1 Peptidase A4 family protein [Streptacidiphilus jiangxiensis]
MRTTRRATALSAALLAVLATAAPAVAVTAPVIGNGTVHNLHVHLRNSSSSNWSGFAATGGGFTSISASWVEPTGKCTSATTYSSFWVGIDGDGSNSVEQTGSEVDCSGGVPQYYSWYEMYPAYPVNFSNTVRPGDHFTGSVTYNGSGKFTMKLSDTTQGWSRSVSKTYSPAQRYSVEVIAEAPSSSTGVLPLTNFGTVNFTNAAANGQALGNYGPDQINMVSGSTTKATTSSLSGGENFSVTWKHA